MLKQKIVLVFLSLRKFKGFRSSVPDTGAETNIYIFYYLTGIFIKIMKGHNWSDEVIG